MNTILIGFRRKLYQLYTINVNSSTLTISSKFLKISLDCDFNFATEHKMDRCAFVRKEYGDLCAVRL